MGELVLAKQGVHEAFSAADRMVSESIRAVTRIVMRPGLVNIGLDDLMAALSSPKSRCLFGSGIAEGENRAQQALKNALVSPLLDRGSLLHDTQTVLVHVCGGEDMTLYELELLMRGLSKHVPETAQILFGTSVDPAMSESLSVTLVSSLPEDRLLVDSVKKVSAKKIGKSVGEDTEGSGDTGSPREELDEDPESPAASEKDSVAEKEQSEARSNVRIRVKELPPVEEVDDDEPISDEDKRGSESDGASNQSSLEAVPSLADTGQSLDLEDEDAFFAETGPGAGPAPINVESLEEIQASAQAKRPQGELALDGGPKGKFDGEDPNLIEGEDLDIPPFLRKKK